MWRGLSSIERVPSPKFHSQEDGERVEVSMKVTFRSAKPEVGYAVKLARGFVATSRNSVCQRILKTGDSADAR